MRRHLTVAAAAVTVLLGGCSGQLAVADAESELVANYLEPLDEGALDYTIHSTCHVDAAGASGKWHLVVDIHVAAPAPEVALLLEEAGAVVRQDRSPAVAQQNPGRPEGGWNGSLADGNGGTRLAMTYNNVAVPAVRSALGWAEACPGAAS